MGREELLRTIEEIIASGKRERASYRTAVLLKIAG